MVTSRKIVCFSVSVKMPDKHVRDTSNEFLTFIITHINIIRLKNQLRELREIYQPKQIDKLVYSAASKTYRLLRWYDVTNWGEALWRSERLMKNTRPGTRDRVSALEVKFSYPTASHPLINYLVKLFEVNYPSSIHASAFSHMLKHNTN